jgi:hypothetical protein
VAISKSHLLLCEALVVAPCVHFHVFPSPASTCRNLTPISHIPAPAQQSRDLGGIWPNPVPQPKASQLDWVR